MDNSVLSDYYYSDKKDYDMRYKSMKILFISNNLVGGGAEKVLLNLLEELDDPLYEITLLLIKNKGVYINDIPKYIQVKYMFDVSKNEVTFPKEKDKLIEYYNSNIGNEFDVEIAFLEGAPTKLLACSTNKRSMKIAWVHIDMNNAHWTYKYYQSIAEEKNCYALMDKVVFVSENAKKGFEKLFDFTPSQSIVIKNPIPIKKIRRLADEYQVYNTDFTFIVVGSLVIRKGQSRLLYAAGRLIEEGYHFKLQFVGEGEQLFSYTELAYLLNIHQYVSFVGFAKNPYPYISNANVLISSSITEGYPLVVCEAIALSVPIIATKCTGNLDVLQNGKYGMIVDNSEEGIYRGMKQVLDSHDAYAELKVRSANGSVELQFEERIYQIKKIISEV